MNVPFQKSGVPATKSRIAQAEARIEQAETRTEQAKTRAESAETRTEQAETRTDSAKTRTEQAETRTEQAETRTEQAETRAEQAETALEILVQDPLAWQRCQPKPHAEAAAETSADFRALERLTARQREVLQLLALGHNTKQSADLLKLSPKTVEYHRIKVMEALKIHDVPGLVRFALRIGLVPPHG